MLNHSSFRTKHKHLMCTSTATAASQSHQSSSPMDPAIWSQIPPELLYHILTFLPLKTLFTFRSTCKLFKSLPFSPPFVSKHSSPSPSPFSSFFLLSHPQCYHYFPIYDSNLNSWRSLSISFSLLLPSASSSLLLSTSNGVSCFSLPTHSSFLVCNLLAMASRFIKFPSHPFQFELLTLISTSNGYKIFLISTGSSSNNVFLYDSNVHSWLKFDSFDPILTNNYHQEGAFYNNCLYFTTPEPFSVVYFDLENGNWENLNTTELPSELTFARLVSNGEGKLYLIGGIGRNGISRKMKIWELNEERNDWEELECLTEMMCRKFVSVCYHNYQHVYCFWHNGNVCVCCYTWPEILYYKVSRRTWHWLPKCPSLPDKWSCGFRWFSFVPNLYAPI